MSKRGLQPQAMTSCWREPWLAGGLAGWRLAAGGLGVGAVQRSLIDAPISLSNAADAAHNTTNNTSPLSLPLSPLPWAPPLLPSSMSSRIACLAPT